jgi:hypothetical protein
MPPSKIAIIVGALLVAMAANIGFSIYVKDLLPRPQALAPNAPNGRQRPGAPRTASQTPQRAPRFDAWNGSQLPELQNPYFPEPLNQSLVLGPPQIVDGLQVQRLNFALMRPQLCVWGPDGATLYLAQGRRLLRIDAKTWRATSQLDLSTPPCDIAGVALTSEGLVVALRSVRIDNWSVPAPNGRRLIHIDPRTGGPPEIESVRVLVVVDPLTLNVVRQFNGPSRRIAGAPSSPILCATDNEREAKLIDLRNGKVLDAAGGQPKPGASDGKRIVGFAELLMSPDGEKLYHGDRSGAIYETDVSTNRFAATRELKPSASRITNIPFDQPTIYLSADGKYLAAYVGEQNRNDGYSIIDTGGDGVDPERQMIATNSTAFTFVGRTSRPLTNCLNMEVAPVDLNKNKFGQLPDMKWVYCDLVNLAREGRSQKHRLFNPKSLERAALLGLPVADQVLMTTGDGSTVLVKLQPGPGAATPASGRSQSSGR